MILMNIIHWGTFNLALHPWYEPMQRLTDAAQSNQIPIATPMVGETISHDVRMLGSRWWEMAGVKF